MSDSLALYTLTLDLASVALSNDYNDLSNLPDLTHMPLWTLLVRMSQVIHY
jgi:hypothetical protein